MQVFFSDPPTNLEIAELLENIATVYDIKNKNIFRITAYKNAAQTISAYPEPLFDIWQKDPDLLDQIPNIGSSIMKKLNFVFRHRKLPKSISNILNQINPTIFLLTKIEGIGPETAHKLTCSFSFPKKPTSVYPYLIKLGQNHHISKLPCFGQKSELTILTNTTNFISSSSRIPYLKAKKIVDDIVHFVHHKFPALQIIVAGSFRRQLPTIGDLDFVIQSDNPKSIFDHLITYPKLKHVINRGNQKLSLKIIPDFRIDFSTGPQKSFGNLLQHATGSKEYDKKLRKYANSLGFRLSEHYAKNLKTNQKYYFSNEEDLFKFLNLKPLPPQNRVDHLEIEKARI